MRACTLVQPSPTPTRDLAPELEATLTSFREYLELERKLSPHTVAAYVSDLAQFLHSLSRQRVAEIDRRDVLAFVEALSAQGVSERSQARKISAVRQFFRFLVRRGRLEEDPTALVNNPRQPRRLPKTINEELVSRLLEAPGSDTAFGLRDRAMLELLYATGVRVT